MILHRERTYSFTEEELGNLEQREYGLLRKVKATIGRARRNIAKKIEEKIDKNIEEFKNASARVKDIEAQKAPKGTYKVLNQIKREVRKEQPNVYFTSKRSKDLELGAFHASKKDLGKDADLIMPKYADYMIFNGRQPNIGATLHEVGHMRRASGKEGAIANFINKKSKKALGDNSPTHQILRYRGAGWMRPENDAINRGGIVNNVKDIANYASKWLEERGANKYANKELDRLLKEGKITKEMYDKGREMTKVSMETYTPSTKVNILSSIKNTIDIPSWRGLFDLKNV